MKFYMNFNIKMKVLLGKIEEIKLFYGKSIFFNDFLSNHFYNYTKIHLYPYNF